jgi:hypothetical protein
MTPRHCLGFVAELCFYVNLLRSQSQADWRSQPKITGPQRQVAAAVRGARGPARLIPAFRAHRTPIISTRNASLKGFY